MTTGIEIVAAGGRSAVGLTAEACAAAVRAGINRVSACPFVAVDAEGEPKMVAVDPVLEFATEGIDRLIPMASAVLDEALTKLGPAGAAAPMEVLVVLPEERPGVTELGLADVGRRMRSQLDRQVRESGATGASVLVRSGPAGVAAAVERVAAGATRANEVLSVVVAVDSFHHPETLRWLEDSRLFGPTARNGFVPGEGAGCLVLASSSLRRQLGLVALARIGGVGVAHELCELDSDAGAFGQGMTAAIQAAVAGSSLPAEAVDKTYSDINGERYRSEEWGFVALRIPSRFRTLDYEAPATSWGHTGAAASALGSILALQSWARGYAPGPRALVVAGSPNGSRSAILLQAPSGR